MNPPGRRASSFWRAFWILAAVTLSGPGVSAFGGNEPPEASALRLSNSPVSELEKSIGELTREEQALRQRFDDLGRRADTARTRAVLRGRAYMRKARAGLLPIGGGFSALVDHAAKLERFRRFIEKDLAAQRALVLERAEVAERLDLVARRLGPLRVDHEALLRAENALLAVEDRERAFERAFSSSLGADHTAVYGASGPADPSAVAAGFSGMRGRLPFPITGRSEVKSARRSSSEGPGLELRAPFGTPVRTIYPGRVAFADEYADYGKTVIVDHGGGYYTVSGNLSSIDVRAGDDLAASARLGSVGDSGRGALVYFEIRKGTSLVDPAEWFGL